MRHSVRRRCAVPWAFRTASSSRSRWPSRKKTRSYRKAHRDADIARAINFTRNQILVSAAPRSRPGEHRPANRVDVAGPVTALQAWFHNGPDAVLIISGRGPLEQTNGVWQREPGAIAVWLTAKVFQRRPGQAPKKRPPWSNRICCPGQDTAINDGDDLKASASACGRRGKPFTTAQILDENDNVVRQIPSEESPGCEARQLCGLLFDQRPDPVRRYRSFLPRPRRAR